MKVEFNFDTNVLEEDKLQQKMTELKRIENMIKTNKERLDEQRRKKMESDIRNWIPMEDLRDF